MTEAEIVELFTYHRPEPAVVAVMESNRDCMMEAAIEVAATLPDCDQRRRFVEHMHAASMQANAALAIHGLPSGPRA